MSTNELARQRNQLVVFGVLALAYGLACLFLLFGYLSEVSQTTERLLATSWFVIGGLVGLYAMLLASLSKIQQEPDKSKSQARFKIVLRVFFIICAIHLFALLLGYSGVVH